MVNQHESNFGSTNRSRSNIPYQFNRCVVTALLQGIFEASSRARTRLIMPSRFLPAAVIVALALFSECIAADGFADGPKYPLTIEDAVKLALRQNSTILQQIQQVKQSEGVVFQVQAALMPNVTGSAFYSQSEPNLSRTTSSNVVTYDAVAVPQNQSVSFRPGLASELDEITLSTGSDFVRNGRWNVQITIGQLLWDGGAAIASRHAATVNEEAAYYALRDTIDSVVLNVVSQFYQVILTRGLVQVQEEAVNLLRAELDDQQGRLDAGTVTRFNVLQAEAQWENQIPRLAAAQRNYRNAQVTLAKILEIPANRQYLDEEPLPVIGSMDVGSFPVDLERALAIARANRPSLKVRRAGIVTAIDETVVAAAGAQPSLSASGSLIDQNYRHSNNLRRVLNGWSFGVAGTWSITDGGLTLGNVRASQAQIEEEKVALDDAERQVEVDVSTAVDDMGQAEETVVEARKGVEISATTLRKAHERFALKEGSQLDVFNAQRQLTTSRSNLLRAEFEWTSARAQYQYATGTETTYNDLFDLSGVRPDGLSPKEAIRARKARSQSGRE